MYRSIVLLAICAIGAAHALSGAAEAAPASAGTPAPAPTQTTAVGAHIPCPPCVAVAARAAASAVKSLRSSKTTRSVRTVSQRVAARSSAAAREAAQATVRRAAQLRAIAFRNQKYRSPGVIRRNWPKMSRPLKFCATGIASGLAIDIGEDALVTYVEWRTFHARNFGPLQPDAAGVFGKEVQFPLDFSDLGETGREEAIGCALALWQMHRSDPAFEPLRPT